MLMNFHTIFVAIALLAGAIAVALVYISGRSLKDKRLTPLASLAFGFILAGLFFGNNLYVGYTFIAIGLVLAIADIYMKSRKKD